MYGQFTRHCNDPTIILEVDAFKDFLALLLWVAWISQWHQYLAEISYVCKASCWYFFTLQLYGEGHQYDQGYYLSNDIYKSWSIFVKTISAPKSRKHKHFGNAQEAQRKDIERTFGVLQSRLAIVLGPARF